MKAKVCETLESTMPTVRNGKVSKRRKEEFEVSLYLDKLQHLLPAPVSPATTCTKNTKPRVKKLTRLEVIESVVQYIRELQEVLDIDVHDREMDLLECETRSITLAA